MEYFKIVQPCEYFNTVRPVFPSISQIWGEEKPILVNGKAERPDKPLQFLPFYQATILSGAFLIAKQVGDIWKEYQAGGRYRPCVLGHLETKTVETYYFMYPRLLDALHKDTSYYADGEIETICLCKEMIQVHKVFGVKGRYKTNVIIAADVLDRMLQEGITGCQFEPVNVKEGKPWQRNM